MGGGGVFEVFSGAAGHGNKGVAFSVKAYGKARDRTNVSEVKGCKS